MNFCFGKKTERRASFEFSLQAEEKQQQQPNTILYGATTKMLTWLFFSRQIDAP